MTFGRFDLTVLLASGTVAGTVGDDRTVVVKCSARAPLDDFLILIFSFLLVPISSNFLSNICNKNNDKEICTLMISGRFRVIYYQFYDKYAV